MPPTFSHTFANGLKSEFSTGLYINGQFVDGVDKTTIDIFNPSTGKVIAQIAEAREQDVELAYQAAQKAFETSWGTKVPGSERGKLLLKLADLMDEHLDELARLETLDNGKTLMWSSGFDVPQSAATIRYYGGWADKLGGDTIEVNDSLLAYTRHEPIGVVGQIIPWNFPIYMFAWKIGPALATGNTVVLKPSEITPLTALRMCHLISEAGFPPGVVNIVTGYGKTAGHAIAAHPKIEKIAFTGSTLIGREIMKTAAATNLKKVTLELGGKSPNIIFEDADLDQAVGWSAYGILFNHGQCCCAGSRVFVQESIYDKFIEKFQAHIKTLKVGDPMEPDTFQGPQISETQYDRIMSYIKTGKEEGATVLMGGERHGTEGYFIQPTIFTDVKPGMKIIQEEIFGPVVAVAKFKTEDDIIAMANDTTYGLAAAVFSRDITRALDTAHKIRAGTIWVNAYNVLHPQIPFGGYKQSGFGREQGRYALDNYTQVKAVQVNLTARYPGSQ